MMNRFVVLLFCLPSFVLSAGAQEKEEGPVQVIRFSGFVKTDIFYDSRQSSAANGIREGHFYLCPDDVLYDEEMNDLNANPSFHILNIQTRIRADITGPDAFGAKIAGAAEAEFFGTGESDLNGFRLRHAYVRMEWPKAVPPDRAILASDVSCREFPGNGKLQYRCPVRPVQPKPTGQADSYAR